MFAKVEILLVQGANSLRAVLPDSLARSLERAGRSSAYIEGRANSFHLPIGALPGRGYVLLSGSDALSLTNSTPCQLIFRTFDSSDAQYNRTVTLSKLFIVSTRSLTGGITPVNQEVVEVELTDIRYILSRTALIAGYNVRTPANEPSLKPYTEGYTNPYYKGDNWTWTTMLQDIWTNAPAIAGALDLSLASFPAQNPENFEFYGVSVLEALEKIANATGNFLVVNLDGQVRLISGNAVLNAAMLSSALPYIVVNSKTLSIPEGLFNTAPEKIVVIFPSRNNAFQLGNPGEPTWVDFNRTHPAYAVEVPTGDPNAIAGTKHIVHGAMAAVYDSSGALLNAAELDAYANVVAGAWKNRFKKPQSLDNVYSGAWPFIPSPEFDAISWYDTGHGLLTRLKYREHWVQEEQLSVSKEWASVINSAVTEALKPSVRDLDDEMEWVDRWGIALLGGNLDPLSSAVATVQYAVTDSQGNISWSNTSHTIRVFEVLNRSYQQGDKVFVIFHRQAGRWLAIGSAASSRLIRFKMKTKLPLGGKGVAIEISTGPTYTERGNPFPIKDPWTDPGMWREDVRDELRPVKGYKGWCILPDDAEILNVSPGDPLYQYNGQPVREIIWMEQIARSITFTALDDLDKSVDPWRLRVSIDNYYLQGKDPADTDLVISPATGDLYVYDPQHQFPRALQTAKGKARYNDRNHRYEIVVCDQQAILIEGVLGGLLCGDPQVALNSVKPMTFPPYGLLNNVSVTAYNPLGLAGEAGDYAIAAWNESYVPDPQNPNQKGAWVLLQVKHKLVRLLRDIRLFDGPFGSGGGSGPISGPGMACNPFEKKLCEVQGQFINAYVMYCEKSDQWLSIFGFHEQEVLTDWWVQGLVIKAMAATIYVPCKTLEYECDLEEATECPTYT